MTQDQLNNEYFHWMYGLIQDDSHFIRCSYLKLLYFLNQIEFTYIIPMDENRACDGIDLRYHFGYINNYDDRMIASYLDDKPCSVLEMMVALANRCEEQIMGDTEIGNRTGLWFWEMIVNLGLVSMMDKKFDKVYVQEVIDRFLNREYKSNGEGGLYRVDHCELDFRTADIWCQMNWYLSSIM